MPTVTDAPWGVSIHSIQGDWHPFLFHASAVAAIHLIRESTGLVGCFTYWSTNDTIARQQAAVHFPRWLASVRTRTGRRQRKRHGWRRCRVASCDGVPSILWRRGYEQVHSEMATTLQRVESLQTRLTELMQSDSDAYAKVIQAYGLPKQTEASVTRAAQRSRLRSFGLQKCRCKSPIVRRVASIVHPAYRKRNKTRQADGGALVH